MAIATQKTLVGWKAIAGYFSRDERTVMRWAASRGMPVQRVAGQARSSVYAWPEDLDAWLGRAPPGSGPAEETLLPLRPQVIAEADPVSIAPPPVAANDSPISPAPEAPVIAEVPAAHRRTERRTLIAIVGLIAIMVAAFALWAMLRSSSSARTPAVSPPGAMPVFHDAGARGAFLQGRFDWNLRTRESLIRAVSEFGEAAARDPGVASSYVGIADSYLLLREHAALPDAVAYARADAAARIAIGLDPRSMAARRSLAFIDFWWRGDVGAAGRQFAEAIALAPGDALTHHWLANALAANGEEAAALREISIARTLDPTSSATLIDYGLIAYLSGHRDEGMRVLRALVAAAPQDASVHRDLGQIALFEGRHQEYLAEAQRAADLRHDASAAAELARRRADFANGGAPLMFERMVDAARDRTRRTDSGFFELARVAAISGRDIAAIDALAPACTRHEHEAIGAAGDLWLSRVVPRTTVRRLCAKPSLDRAVAGARWAG